MVSFSGSEPLSRCLSDSDVGAVSVDVSQFMQFHFEVYGRFVFQVQNNIVLALNKLI